MRTVILLAFVVFLPAFACAANPPTLTTYTLSYDTIYPTAAAGSGLATTTSIDTAFSEQVKVSIKITSASGTTVKSLYSSSSVTNPAPKVWDGTNTSGTQVANGTYTILISATSTATSLPMTDSSKTIIVTSSDSTPPDASSDTDATSTPAVTSSSSSGAPPEYIHIPILHIVTGGNRTVSSGADVAFSATVYDSKGNKRNDAIISWSFGDGMRRTGPNVFHAYYDPGEYAAVVHATTSDGGDALMEMVITAEDAGIKITSVSSRGITLLNNDSRTLDLSLWKLSMGGKEFKIPEDTYILAGHTTLFSSRVIELPIADLAFLLYPSGEVASEYPESHAQMKLFQPEVSTNTVQAVKPPAVSKVEPIISTKSKAKAPAHGKQVSAPATTTKLAAAGAALPQPKAMSAFATASASSTKSVFTSPWTISLLGVIAAAGSAFIFL